MTTDAPMPQGSPSMVEVRLKNLKDSAASNAPTITTTQEPPKKSLDINKIQFKLILEVKLDSSIAGKALKGVSGCSTGGAVRADGSSYD